MTEQDFGKLEMKRIKTTRSVEFNFERWEYFVQRRTETLAWCEDCGMAALFVTSEEAAQEVGTSVRAIFRRIEAAQIHFIEPAGRGLLVCLKSLRSREGVEGN